MIYRRRGTEKGKYQRRNEKKGRICPLAVVGRRQGKEGLRGKM